MAEEVKIVDVAGGPAAEATLQEILKIMKGGAGGGGGGGGGAGDKAATKAQDLYTTAVTRGTKTSKDNASAVEGATDSTITFGSTLSSVGGLIGSAFGAIIGVTKNLTEAFSSATTIGGVLQAVPIFGSVLSSATGYFQTSVDTFRQLSDVGAGFGNDMMAMRRAATESGLSLEQFASVIGNNSQSMRLLGGTTSEGASRFGRLSKALRSQEAGLLRLGYTQEQVNEGLADYIEGQALAGQMRGRTDASLTAGAQNYLKEIDALAKVTGKSRKELQDEINARNQAANINVLAARLSGTALDNFNNNMQFSSSIMNEDFANAMADMADGVSQTPLAQMLESNIPGLKELQEQNATGAISQQEYQSRLMALLPRITQLSDSMGAAGVTAMLGAEGAGEFAQMTARARVAQQTFAAQQEAGAAAERARQEQLRRAPLTETFANFEQTIQNVRSAFENALIDSGILETVGGLMGDLGTGMTTLAQDGVSWLANYLKSDSFKTAFSNFKTWISDAATKVKTFIDDIGKIGFKEAVSKLFSGDGESSFNIGEMFGNFVSDAFGALLPSLDTVLVGLAAGIATLIFAPVAAPFLAIGAALAAMFGWSTIKGWVSDAWDGITGMFSGITEWWNSVDFMSPISNAWNSFTGMFSGIGEWWDGLDFMTPLTNAWNKVKSFFSLDTEFSISKVATDMWNSVTGWFGMEGLDFSISALGTVAWEAVKAWFSFGTDVAFSIAQLGIDAWATVVSWFGFGDGTGFSISELATNAWNTVTSWFSMDGIEIPSISEMFSGILAKVRSFFDFDFEMPSFKSFLPSWMGGDSDEPGTTSTASVAQPATSSTQQALVDLSQPANITAMGGLDFASQAEGARILQAVLADIGSMQSFNNELERIQLGLDSNRVNSYNEAMERLVATLEDLNDVLSEDNRGMLGGGTGVAAANVIGGMNSGGASEGSGEQIERLNMLVSQLVSLTQESNRYSRDTVRAINGNLQMGV